MGRPTGFTTAILRPIARLSAGGASHTAPADHLAACVASGFGITPTVRMRQQHNGKPEGLR
jgi:hypothetical protein